MKGQEYSSAVEHLLCIWEALDLIPSITKASKQKQKEWQTRWYLLYMGSASFSSPALHLVP